MCEPVSAGLAIASVGANFVAQDAHAKGQSKVAAQNQENARLANKNTLAQINERTAQQAAQAGDAITKVRKQALAARSTAAAAAAESGVTGQSVDAILDDFTRQEGEFVAATLLNEKFQQEAAELEKAGAQISLSGGLLGNLGNKGPSEVLAALQAGVAGLGAFNNASAARRNQ